MTHRPHRCVVGRRAGLDGTLQDPPDADGRRGSVGMFRYVCGNGEEAMQLEPGSVLPPGRDPRDRVGDWDAVGSALGAVQCMLVWAAEHHASFVADRVSNPAVANVELVYLEDVIRQGVSYFERLRDLLLAGYTIDSNKRLPQELYRRLT